MINFNKYLLCIEKMEPCLEETCKRCNGYDQNCAAYISLEDFYYYNDIVEPIEENQISRYFELNGKNMRIDLID